jgi:cell division protein FtsB
MANRIKGVTGRFVALSVVFFLIALTVAPPMQRYFSQRAQISAVEAQIGASKDRLLKAEAELARWRDPAYVKSQARDRLHFVLPGERQYIVVGAKSQSEFESGEKNAVADQLPDHAPWYERLISSIQTVATSGAVIETK